MLSWTFAAAAVVVIVVSGVLPARFRALAFAVLSIAGVALVWHVPMLAVLAVALGVFGWGRLLPRLPEPARGWALTVGVVAVVAGLAAYKRGPQEGTELTTMTSVVGVSYFALKFIQHLVDARSGRTDAVDLPAFLCTIFFLPTYAAGPIERTTDFARELRHADRGMAERVFGVERVLFGLAKKLVLADTLVAHAQPLLVDPATAPPLYVLGAVYGFALGLYLDFSGYSDVAIGLAQCAGVRVRENFDHPYLRRNIGLLWQHWHMSLTGWLRDFVFMPVSRRVLRVTRRPLVSQLAGQAATMLLCGLWHGLRWHYAVWGLYNAAGLGALAAWRAWRGPAPAGTPARDVIATLATFHFFALGLLLFDLSIAQAGHVLARLLALVG
jgi:alginate O-acetyltransferase complex protein AlgI